MGGPDLCCHMSPWQQVHMQAYCRVHANAVCGCDCRLAHVNFTQDRQPRYSMLSCDVESVISEWTCCVTLGVINKRHNALWAAAWIVVQ